MSSVSRYFHDVLYARATGMLVALLSIAAILYMSAGGLLW
jgi:hypothetical protein